MTKDTVESFKAKVLRMFIPINARKYANQKKVIVDPDIIDPLERFEKSILREAEDKKDARDRQTKT